MNDTKQAMEKALEALEGAENALMECDRDGDYPLLERIDEATAAIRTALSSVPDVQTELPEGFRLLPVEATDSMMDADWNVTMSEAHSSGGVSAAAWRAMVEAAPQVTYGNGHSGVGWYMHDTEYPEEGAVFLSEQSADGVPEGDRG